MTRVSVLGDSNREQKLQIAVWRKAAPHEDRKSEGEKEREREKIWGKKLGYFCGVFYIEKHKIVG